MNKYWSNNHFCRIEKNLKIDQLFMYFHHSEFWELYKMLINLKFSVLWSMWTTFKQKVMQNIDWYNFSERSKAFPELQYWRHLYKSTSNTPDLKRTYSHGWRLKKHLLTINWKVPLSFYLKYASYPKVLHFDMSSCMKNIVRPDLFHRATKLDLQLLWNILYFVNNNLQAQNLTGFNKSGGGRGHM